MRATFSKVRDILPVSQRRQAAWLIAMTTVMALLETATVVSIVPFMTVVANPEIVQREGWLSDFYTATGVQSESRFLFILGLGMLFVLVVGNGFKALTTWLLHRFTHIAGHVVGVRLLRAYLAQPYTYFLNRHSADLAKNVLAEVQQVMAGIIQPGLMALSRAVVAIFLTALLFVVNYGLALSVVLVLGGAYAVLYVTTRFYLTRIGQERYKANRERFHITSEAFSGIKEIKLRHLERAYTERFSTPSLNFALRQAANQTLALVPRYGLEVIAFSGILTIVLYLLAVEKGLESALPLIALYVFAGYRMLPTLQEIFAGLAKVRFAQPALDLLHRDLIDKAATPEPPRVAAPLPFEKAIRLKNVAYRYPAGDRQVLEKITLEIPKGTRIGFIGPTGSGKSTVVDLILGLLRPAEGSILVDGVVLDSEEVIRRWQRQVGYVPQHIFLADDTIAANIAFGQKVDSIDYAAVERAARMAQLHDFIVEELPAGYETSVGERGICLSGGQRQRLGLARALYRDPALLVLDEATSALDIATEEEVMKALDGLDPDCTVILIAHRLSTVRQCQTLFKLEHGRIAASGSCEEILDVKGAARG